MDRERKHAIGFEEIWIRFKGINNYVPAQLISYLRLFISKAARLRRDGPCISLSLKSGNDGEERREERCVAGCIEDR